MTNVFAYGTQAQGVWPQAKVSEPCPVANILAKHVCFCRGLCTKHVSDLRFSWYDWDVYLKIAINILAAFFVLPFYAHAQDDVSKKIEDHFGLYIIEDARRSKADLVKVKQQNNSQAATLYYWRNLEGRNPSDVICDAYRWLLQGRTRYGKGAKSAFSKFSSINSFELMFYDLAFGTKRGKKKGDFLPSMKAKQYVRVRVSRSNLKKQNFKKAWIDKQIEDNNCSALRELFDSVSFDENYMRKKV